MSLRKLVSMTHFVDQCLDYVRQSHNHQRGIDLIRWYADLIQTPLSVEMFRGAFPLFPNFEVFDRCDFTANQQSPQSFIVDKHPEFSTRLYRKSEHSSHPSGMCYITSYHLKTIEDLCDKDITFSMLSEYAKSDLFD